MRAFKLRAECLNDVYNFLSSNKCCHISSWVISKRIESDIELEFESVLSLNEITEILSEIPDAHVMIQTLSEKEFYTGTRNYNLI